MVCANSEYSKQFVYLLIEVIGSYWIWFWCGVRGRMASFPYAVDGFLIKLAVRQERVVFYPHFFKNCYRLRPSVLLSPPKPWDELQPNLMCELLA